MKIKSYEDLMKYVNKYKNNSRKIINLKENFMEYLDLCNEQNIMSFINELKSIPEMEQTLYYNSDFICRKFGIQTILKMTQGMNFKKRFKYICGIYESIRIKYYTIDEFISDLLDNNEMEYICSNMEQIISSTNIEVLIDKGLLEKFKELDPEKFKEMHSAIVCKMTNIRTKFMDSTILYGITSIIDEIAKNENTDISKLEFVGTGDFARVYKLGSKVIKFGEKRLTDKIPYHRRILQPLIRRKILSGFKNLYIEISEYIQPDNSITDEDAYLVYKELRDDGIIWFDAKKENLGRLQKDNVAHFKEPLYVKNETVGYIKETLRKDEPLKKGELIIIDTDMLFRENDFNIALLDEGINTYFYDICEQRYQNERKSIKNNKINKILKNLMEKY